MYLKFGDDSDDFTVSSRALALKVTVSEEAVQQWILGFLQETGELRRNRVLQNTWTHTWKRDKNTNECFPYVLFIFMFITIYIKGFGLVRFLMFLDSLLLPKAAFIWFLFIFLSKIGKCYSNLNHLFSMWIYIKV